MKKEYSICETLDKIESENKRLNAFLSVNQQAKEIKVDYGLPLQGMPIAVKDNICTEDMKTTCASRMLSGFKPGYDAHAVERLRKAGAVIIGKTNMDEFGMGSTGENSAFGHVVNPCKDGYAAGGSSSGSAAAVAAGIVPAALGSDTGGSVRQPAAYCGVVGLKPSYGAVSRFGLIAFASSMDQIGILAKDVETTAQIARVIYGRDDGDQTSREIHIFEDKEFSVSGIKIGVSDAYNQAADSAVKAGVKRAISALEKCGAKPVNVNVPMTEYLLPMYYILSSAEASSNLARFDGIKYGLKAEGCESVDEMIKSARSRGFGDEVKRRILLGTFVLSEGYYSQYYQKAELAREKLRRECDALFRDECDFFISPVCKTVAPKLGELTQKAVSIYESDYYTVIANLVGYPAISIPVGCNSEGLPIGVQIMARHGMDSELISLARVLERQIKGGDVL